MLSNTIKSLVVTVLLIAVSGSCRMAIDGDVRGGFFTVGYSDDFELERHSVDLNVGLVFMPDFCRGCELGVGFIHTQLNFSGDHQPVSDDEVLHFAWFLATALPLVGASIEYNMESPFYVAVIAQYLWNGYAYLPLMLEDRIGVVNKNRFVSQVFSEGFSAKAFTFQDDLGVRYKMDFCAKDGREHSYCAYDIDFGVRLIKNFDEPMDTGLFLQVGL